MNKNVIRQWAVMLSLVATVIVNAMASALPLNGQTNAEISDRYPSFFTPAGYVFSIWGLIYLGLLAYAIFQALPAQKENPRLQTIGYLFVASCLANILWILVWHFELFILSFPALAAIAVLLAAIYLRLGIGTVTVSTAERWCVHIPFSIYLAWSIIATIANASWLLHHWNWNRWGIAAETWAVIMLFVGLALAGWVIIRYRDTAFGLVWIWAYSGIAVKFSGTPVVATAAWIATAALAVMILAQLFFSKTGHESALAPG